MSETAPATITYEILYAEFIRAHRRKMTWVMDLASYKQIRRVSAAVRPGSEPDEDEGKWVPSTDDRLLELPILVREDGGEPHIEWLTPEELAQ